MCVRACVRVCVSLFLYLSQLAAYCIVRQKCYVIDLPGRLCVCTSVSAGRDIYHFSLTDLPLTSVVENISPHFTYISVFVMPSVL